jgi:xanthine/CO dehydrogenase XdhC/CoxF family maturation factor
MTSPIEDPACATAHGGPAPAAVPSPDAIAHGAPPPEPDQERALVAVFASPVAAFLLRYAADAGYRPVLVEPDPDRRAAARDGGALPPGTTLAAGVKDADRAGGQADVVVTDHHRPELGVALRDALAGDARWIGIMGKAGHVGPHIAALTELGVAPEEIARVHRPIGINIGSRTPAEIAISTIAGLIADRNDRPGGFSF